MKKTLYSILAILFISTTAIIGQGLEMYPLPENTILIGEAGIEQEHDIKPVPMLDHIDYFFVDTLGGLDIEEDDTPTSVQKVGKKYGGTRIVVHMFIDNNEPYFIAEYYCDYIFTNIRCTDDISLIYLTKLFVEDLNWGFCRYDINKYFKAKINAYMESEDFQKDLESTFKGLEKKYEVKKSTVTRVDEHYEKIFSTDKSKLYGKFTIKITLKEKEL